RGMGADQADGSVDGYDVGLVDVVDLDPVAGGVVGDGGGEDGLDDCVHHRIDEPQVHPGVVDLRPALLAGTAARHMPAQQGDAIGDGVVDVADLAGGVPGPQVLDEHVDARTQDVVDQHRPVGEVVVLEAADHAQLG